VRTGPVAAAALALGLGCAAAAHAQNLQDADELTLQGQDATPAELEAWRHIEEGKYVRARELGERILQREPSSFVAHLVVGYAQHYAEDNLPRALYHLGAALRLYEGKHGTQPDPGVPWRWHAALLHELADVHGDMEHHQEKLTFIGRYNELYDPDMISERAWPLMKLGRYAEARLAAELGLSADRPPQRVIALNALCAIEFEAGNDGASYEACRRAIDDADVTGGGVSAVDLTNFAEASRSMFKLDEAERVALQATTALPSWYGNPWMELAELYVRQGRFGEALSALKQIPEYRMRRPPHVREADRNEMRRVLASFLVVLGKPEQAYDMTGRAIAAPERRAHNSRDPAQDRTVLALLDRRGRRMAAELLLERAATEPWYARPLSWAKAAWLRVDAQRSASLVEKLLSDDARLTGSFRIGTASSAVMPPWLLGELVEVLGPGVVAEATRRARSRDRRAGVSAYYDAVEAEVAWTGGEGARAVKLADRALAALGPSEILLQARLMAIAADAAREQGQMDVARARYDAAFQRDPGVFRRLELAVAVEVRPAGGEIAHDVASMLARAPRFRSERGGLALSVRADRASSRVCLSGGQGEVIACAESRAKRSESGDDFAARAAQEALTQLFSPRVDLTQMDINSLDGQNLSGRDALQTVFEW
jgi:tetratricopeptide (TPR) repeat protein